MLTDIEIAQQAKMRPIAEVAEKIASKMFYISMKTYFAKKKKAIGYLSDILWGFTSKDCLPIIKDLVDER